LLDLTVFFNAVNFLEFRCLIPAAASGAVIGRAGAIVKQIGEATKCRLKLGDYHDPYDTKERLLSVNGQSIASIVSAVLLVHERMLAEAATSIYANPKTVYPLYKRGQLPPQRGPLDYAVAERGYPGYAVGQDAYGGYARDGRQAQLQARATGG